MMDDLEDKMNTDKLKIENVPMNKEKPKKRSLVERELETSLTALITSPVANEDGLSTSRYGRARRIKNNSDFCDTEKSVTNFLKSPQYGKTIIKCQPTSPVYRMQASNSQIHESSPKLVTEANLHNRIESIYNTNISLSRFGSDEENVNSQSPAKKYSKVYMSKNLIQSNEKDDQLLLIKNTNSPARSSPKSNSHLSNILERSSEKYNLSSKQNCYLDTASVVKTLDFDCQKKRKDSRDSKVNLSKSDLFELEAKCMYQVGDICWARMGTFPFWPCIITREPGTEIFVKMKLYGKSEHALIHVTFFGDNGRRSWIMDSMLRNFQGLTEFETARDQFTTEAKKKDPKLYAAFFVSDKKLALWHTAIEEAESLQREPKRLRIDVLNEMLGIYMPKNTPCKTQKSSKVTRTDSDVSLSESLFDSLFSEDDSKIVEAGLKKNKTLDVSEVVTACLDNMAAKSGITMIQRQSHMDIWLQKAKSKTPEKLNVSVMVEKIENERSSKAKDRDTNIKSKCKRENNSKKRRKHVPAGEPVKKPYSFRKSTESRNLFFYNNEHDYSKPTEPDLDVKNNIIADSDNTICVIDNIESLCGLETEIMTNEDSINMDILQEIVTDLDHTHNEAHYNNEKADVVVIEDNNVELTVIVTDGIEIKSSGTNPSEQIELNHKLTENEINTPCAYYENHDSDIIKKNAKQDATTTKITTTVNSLEEIENKIETSTKADNSISIKNDTMISQSSLETILETVNNTFNENDGSISNAMKNQESPKSGISKKDETVLNHDFDMSVDDDTLSCLNNDKSSETHYDNKITDTSSVKSSDYVSKVNDCKHEINLCNSDYEDCSEKYSGKEQDSKLPILSHLGDVKDKSIETPELISNSEYQVGRVKSPETVLTNNSFNSMPSNWELAPPKRRSSRKIETKKVKHIPMEEPGFLQYLELKQDFVAEEYPGLSQKEITEYLYKTWQFENNISQEHSSRRKSKSPSEFIAEVKEEQHIKITEEKEDSKNPVLEITSKTKKNSKRLRLKLHKSLTPTVVKKVTNKLQVNKIDAMVINSQLTSKPKAANQKKNNAIEVTKNLEPEISTPKIENVTKHGLEQDKETLNDIKPNKDIWFVTSDSSGISLRLSKALLEPKVVLERKNEIFNRFNMNAGKKVLQEEKQADKTENEITTKVEPKLYLEIKPLDKSNKFKSHSESCISVVSNLEKSEKQGKKEEIKIVTIPNSPSILVKESGNRVQDVVDPIPSDLHSELQQTPLSKRRSLRIRKSQSPSRETDEKQKQNNDQNSSDKMTQKVTENGNDINELTFIVADDHVPNQNESSNIVIVPVEHRFTIEQDEVNSKTDSISLTSDLTNGFIDHSSDKDFDPETISLNSLSSDVSNITEILPKNFKGKSKSNEVFGRLVESDNESVSSLDDIALSELKTRSRREDTGQIEKQCTLETPMDSLKTNGSEDQANCLVDGKDSNLPVIKEVYSEENKELEISYSNADTKSLQVPLVNDLKASNSASPKLPIIVKVEVTETLKPDPDSISIKSSGSEASSKRKGRNKQKHKPMEEPEFLKYVEMRQDALLDEHPEVTPDEVAAYLYKTWLYEESLKSEEKKNHEIESSSLVKGTGHPLHPVFQEQKKKKTMKKKLIDIEKVIAKTPLKARIMINKDEIEQRELPKRKASKAFYKEDFSDIEDEIEMFEIFKTNKKLNVPKIEDATSAFEITTVKEECNIKGGINIATEAITVNGEIATDPKTEAVVVIEEENSELEYYDEEELYFEQLTNPKPNIFKGFVREKVCEICEKTTNLVKCKGCNGMFHIECVKKEDEFIEVPVPTRGRKKKRKPKGRKPKHSLDSNEESHSDEKSQDLNASEENMSLEEIVEPIVIPDADNFEIQLEAKMKELIGTVENIEYDSYSSDDGIDWADAVAGKCEIVDIKPKLRPQPVNTDDFKCKNCQKDDTPICFVCKSPVSPKNNVERRQKCQVAHCHKYYHLDCLEHWPQTQLNAGEPSKNNKKIDEHFEALTCPRHVCHTCVCDDPRGCKTRFSGDKLARCVRCPATYHSFTKCLPAGSQILSASHIVCPRHYEHRPGKIPYHVNTGWCFICALGGNLICCDHCPTSFHADCLNIEPPEGGYMCEDCETGRLPLYGEMVWVKLGHYRWWPGIVLHPSEIPDNILAVKHSPGEFVVRFFGQYDHYWVNRGRVFPFQEGDSGRISTQKSKIDEAFTKAMEHAKRAFDILKNVEPNDEETQDIQSSLLPPHYVKLKVNKPCGALYGRKVDIEESSLTQCECNPAEEDPCGPYTHCLNRMLLTECGPICRSGERCQNRAFEKRQYPKMAPYRTPHRGWGLKTLEPIRAGQFVIEYVGELIDEAEFRRRMQRMHETRDENFYFLTLDKERLIDAGPKGNLARFMNHCCEPNCETQKWTVLGDVRVGLFAIHDIPANTEVTFNYNLECTGIEKKQCMCGAKRCAGYIGAKPKQDEPQPKKLKLAAKRTYKKRKNTTESQSPTVKIKPKRPVGRPAKPRELTEIEKDLLIIKNATNGISSDSECSGRLSSVDDKDKNSAKPLKRKRESFSTDGNLICNGNSSPSIKKIKLDEDFDINTNSSTEKKIKLDENFDKSTEVGD